MLFRSPRLLIVESGETFGVLESAHTATFGGLLEVKEEPGNDDFILLSEQADEAREDICQELGIDLEDLNNLLNCNQTCSEDVPPANRPAEDGPVIVSIFTFVSASL